MKRLTTLFASFLIIASLPAQAASIVAAERAFQQQNYDRAMDELKPLVRDGDPQAVYLMGVMIRDGLGQAADKDQALSYFELAAREGHLESVNAMRSIKNEAYKIEFDNIIQKAEQGIATAQNRVGEMYEYAQGVPRNLEKAFEWYSKAAAQDLVAGWHNVARCYNFGNGVELSYTRAEALYRKAANEGYAESMFFLGTLYATYNGNDDSVNPDILAYAWMHSASERGSLTASTIEERLLMKLNEQDKEEAKMLATAFAGRFVKPFE